MSNWEDACDMLKSISLEKGVPAILAAVAAAKAGSDHLASKKPTPKNPKTKAGWDAARDNPGKKVDLNKLKPKRMVQYEADDPKTRLPPGHGGYAWLKEPEGGRPSETRRVPTGHAKLNKEEYDAIQAKKKKEGYRNAVDAGIEEIASHGDR